jgi:queuine/archaeosine tRNA-ribosyltransferase
MADICIIYAREDHAIAQKLYDLLSQQWDVWWDEKIVGDFAKVIEIEIPRSGCVVPLFSKNSREKGTVTDEIRLGEKNSRKILPVQLDNSDAPLGFGYLSKIDMCDWSGGVDHSGFKLLQQKISSVVLPKNKPQRPEVIANGKVRLPAVFMSVSSHETQLAPPHAVWALRVYGEPTILVSAYDLVDRRTIKTQAMLKELKKIREKGGFVLVDSGRYEASRLANNSWRTKHLRDVLAYTPHDWAFCFDVMKPNHDPELAISELIMRTERNRKYTSFPVLPIVHTPKLKQGGYNLKYIPQVVFEVSKKLQPPLIAIPERELGAGLISRAKTIQLIRKELNRLPSYQPLHILGTGNPWTIPIFAAAGADTFDGLEWCRMAVDRSTHRLHHFQHFDFFTNQRSAAVSTITRAFLESEELDFVGKVAFHNLDYYTEFVKDMRQYFKEDNIEAFVTGIMGGHITKQLKQSVPNLFK